MPRRSIPRDLALLSLLCGLVYFTGLTTHGLTNWQEAQRAQVVREMQQSGDWVVPRIDGRPYLNKPPLVYWCQLAIASIRGARTSELDLRLTVALAGWLGVIATYLVARRLLRPITQEPDPERIAWANEAAWWAALMLATGLLYTRSSRIGELDILLIPFTVVSIGAVHAAWRSWLLGRRTNWGAIALGAAAACGVMLTKGPPGLLVIALAAYGGMFLWAAWQEDGPDGRPSADRIAVRPASRRAVITGFVGAAALAVAAAVLSQEPLLSLDGLTGLLAFAAIGFGLGATIAQVSARRAWTLFLAYSRTHPVLVLGLPFGALAWWFHHVSARLGGWGAVRATIQGETGDNLRPLVLASPLNNFEAVTYAVGLGSLCLLFAGMWLCRRRPALPAGWWFVVAWVVLGLTAFSVFGKGVPRYLTPLWPGIAIVSGSWLAWKLRHMEKPGRLRAAVLAAVVCLGAGQAWWYGYAREHPPAFLESAFGPRPRPSPRAFLSDLLLPGRNVLPGRLGTFEFDTPQIDYYLGLGQPIPAFVDSPAKPGIVIIRPRNITDLAANIRGQRAFTLLIRKTQPHSAGFDPEPALDRLRELFEVDVIPVRARYTIDNGRTEVIAVRLRGKE